MNSSRRKNRPPNPFTRKELLSDCRKILGKLVHGRSVWEFAVSRDVVETLEELDLVRVTSSSKGEMLYEAKPRAAGYCADPSTFEL